MCQSEYGVCTASLKCRFVGLLAWIACAVLAANASAGLPDPQSSTIWLGGDGSWSNPANWNSYFGFDALVFSVLIDGGNPRASNVLLDVDVSLNMLGIDPDDALIIQDGRSLTISPCEIPSMIENEGLIRLGASQSATSLVVGFAGDVSVGGGGSIELVDAARSQIIGAVAGAHLTNLQNTIHGRGNIGANSLGLTNGGIIDADVPFQDLIIAPDSSGIINTGTLRASAGGRLRVLNAVVQNTGGLIQALDGSRIDLDGSSIIGGALASRGNGLIRTMYVPASWQDLANQSTFELGPTKLTIQGTITNDGSINAVAGDTINPPAFSEIVLPPGAGDVTIQGSGSIDMRWCEIDSGTGAPAGRLIHGPNHTISGEGPIGLNTVGLVNHGTIIADRESAIVIDPPAGSVVENDGMLRASGPGGLVLSGGTFKNDGTLEVLDGSHCIYTASSTELNIADSTLMAGTWNVLGDKSPTFILMPGPGVFFNNANVTLSGAGSSFNLINTMAVNSGHFTIRNGRNFTSVGAFFDNAGELTIGAGCRFNAGDMFTQNPGGVLHVEVNEANLTPATSGLIVSGLAILSATLQIEIGEGFQPVDGQVLHIAKAASIAGKFDSVITPPGMTVSYAGNEILINVSIPCDGDINGSGSVGVDDLQEVIAQWGVCPAPPALCTADLTHDGMVNVPDLMVVINAWGPCP